MLKHRTGTRVASASLLAVLSLLLTGCFLSPGKFTSELVLQNNSNFAFSYEGEIFFLGLSKMAEMGAGADGESFQASECYDDDSYEERPCTEAEIAAEKAEWDANAEVRQAHQEKEAKQMAAMMGGLDPSDPEAADALARRLQRQRGWNKVEHAGDGVFNVEFAISGELSHDIIFPLIERFPVPTQFVQVILRDDNQVRVEAPGFATQESGNPMAGMMGGMAGLAAMSAAEGADADPEIPNVPEMEGTFTIITDGRILANNTDEGPVASTGGQKLTWDISKRTQNAPTALIRLDN